MLSKPDPARPWKAIAAFVGTFLVALYATVQGRTDLDTMKPLDWVIVLLGALASSVVTYAVKNPQVPAATIDG